MARAGKEPAEDVKRAIHRAIRLVGLEVHQVGMHSLAGQKCRVVHGTASPEDWPHKIPAIELLAMVGFNGSVSEVQIHCSATDGDPLEKLFVAPKLQNCSCPLTELPATLKEVWISRRQVIDRLKSGETSPLCEGPWTWAVPDMELPGIE